jgi:hypothetical protein
MKKSINRKKPFRRRTRKNKSSRKIKGGEFGWDKAIQFIETYTLTQPETMFKFIGPNPEYFIARVSVTKFPYSFATIELTAENFDGADDLKNISSNNKVHFNNLGICKFKFGNASNVIRLTFNHVTSGEATDCNKLIIYKPAFGRTHSNWFWNEWLKEIKMCRRDRGTMCEINESSATVSTA